MSVATKCPRCACDLVAWNTEKGISATGCQRCKGVFLGRVGLGQHAPRQHAVQPHLDSELLESKPSFFKCPGCGGEMTLGGLIAQDLRVDRCNTCRGIWFDTGEVDRFFELAAALPATSAASRPGPVPAGALDDLRVPSRRTPIPPAQSAFRFYLVVLILIATAVGFYFKNPLR